MRHEAPMSEREIASILKVSHMSVNRTLKELAENNMVSFVSAGKAHLWKLNRSSYGFKVISGIIEKIALLEPPLNDLIKTIKRGIPSRLVVRVVLFGSVAKGGENAASDIDLFLVAKDRQAKKELAAAAEELSNKCLDLYGNKLSAYILTQRETFDVKNTNIFQEIEKGIHII
jgi:predicted nucleotidyltransferase